MTDTDCHTRAPGSARSGRACTQTDPNRSGTCPCRTGNKRLQNAKIQRRISRKISTRAECQTRKTNSNTDMQTHPCRQTRQTSRPRTDCSSGHRRLIGTARRGTAHTRSGPSRCRTAPAGKTCTESGPASARTSRSRTVCTRSRCCWSETCQSGTASRSRGRRPSRIRPAGTVGTKAHRCPR